MEKVAVYLDSGFLSEVNKRFGGGIPLKYDLLKFVKNFCGKENLIFRKLYYYTAPPFQSGNPNNEEKKRKEKYDRFINKLKSNPEIVVREGRVQKIKENGRTVYRQKGVDTLLTMDLVKLGSNNEKIKTAVLIACDTDFVPVVKDLIESGIEVILYTYYERSRKSKFSTSNHLIQSTSRYVSITKEDLLNASFD